MTDKKQYKTDELFWKLLHKSGIHHEMAEIILNSRRKLNKERLKHAYELTAKSEDLKLEAWTHFSKLNSDEDIVSNFHANPNLRRVELRVN